jgi:hypothetical protein
MQTNPSHCLTLPSKVVKNVFLTRHEIYNINSDRKIVKSHEKYFNKLYIDNFSQVVNNSIIQLK